MSLQSPKIDWIRSVGQKSWAYQSSEWIFLCILRSCHVEKDAGQSSTSQKNRFCYWTSEQRKMLISYTHARTVCRHGWKSWWRRMGRDRDRLLHAKPLYARQFQGFIWSDILVSNVSWSCGSKMTYIMFQLNTDYRLSISPALVKQALRVVTVMVTANWKIIWLSVLFCLSSFTVNRRLTTS